jgi:predicted nucleotidyltransferase
MPAGALDSFVARHGVRLLVQFGSTVTGLTHPGSDLDLGVLLERVPERFEDEIALRADAQALFPGREVDLAILNRADPLLLKKVMETGRLLAGTPRAFHEFRMYAFRRYQDHRRYLALERDYVRRRIEALAR